MTKLSVFNYLAEPITKPHAIKRKCSHSKRLSLEYGPEALTTKKVVKGKKSIIEDQSSNSEYSLGLVGILAESERVKHHTCLQMSVVILMNYKHLTGSSMDTLLL